MTRHEFIHNYWHYYLLLEKRFVQTLNYVELDPDNHDVFSNEYANLMQTICAELDSFFKVYCGFNSDDRKSMNDYSAFVLGDYPSIISQEVTVYETKLVIKPFDGWNTAKPADSLGWWAACNRLKHSRAANKKDASQINTLKALSALFLMEMKYLKKSTDGTSDIDIPDEQSALFGLKGWTFRNVAARDAYFVLSST